MRQRQSPNEETLDGVRHLHRGPRIANPPSRPLVAMLRFMLTAFWHVLTHRYDVIDCQTYAPLPAVWLACLLSRQRMVATIHNVWCGSGTGILASSIRTAVVALEAVLYRIPYHRILTVSESSATALARRGARPDRVRVVPNGIVLPPPPPATDATSRVYDAVFVGRLVGLKRIDHVIECLERLSGEGILRRAAIVGEGPLFESARTQADVAGLGARVEFPGGLPNPQVLEVVQSSRIYLHASVSEGFPVVMVEAMACGTPVVAYDILGVREVVENGRDGILVPCLDVEALAEAAGRLLRDPEARQRMADAGREKVERSLTLDAMTARVEAVYAEALRQ
jgi:glycosyltransferase involved in cell wall biosynthesis